MGWGERDIEGVLSQLFGGTEGTQLISSMIFFFFDIHYARDSTLWTLSRAKFEKIMPYTPCVMTQGFTKEEMPWAELCQGITRVH